MPDAGTRTTFNLSGREIAYAVYVSSLNKKEITQVKIRPRDTNNQKVTVKLTHNVDNPACGGSALHTSLLLSASEQPTSMTKCWSLFDRHV